MNTKTVFGVLAVLLIGLWFAFVSHGARRVNESIPAAATSSVAAVAVTQTSSLSPDTYPVIKVIDGDTLAVEMDGKSVTLRLIGLDTPETVDPRKPVQCFGKAASDKAKELLTGTSVRIEKDPSQGEYDKYGRTLAYVYLPSGTLFNEYMISEGYGHEYTYNLPYKYQKEFKAAEAQARAGKKGLWADGACDKPNDGFTKPIIPQKSLEVRGSTYDCSRNAYNCSSFSSQAEAQYVFNLCGGDSNDVHKLDGDRDGNVCESLP